MSREQFKWFISDFNQNKKKILQCLCRCNLLKFLWLDNAHYSFLILGFGGENKISFESKMSQWHGKRASSIWKCIFFKNLIWRKNLLILHLNFDDKKGIFFEENRFSLVLFSRLVFRLLPSWLNEHFFANVDGII